MVMETKSRVLVIGATGRLGRELVKSSLDLRRPTFALIREPTFSDPGRSHLIQSFSLNDITPLKGSLDDFSSLLDAVKRVDAVVCAVPSKHVLDQKLLIQAIKEAGCIKIFATITRATWPEDSFKRLIKDLWRREYQRSVQLAIFVKDSDVAAFAISTIDDPRTLTKVLYLRPPGNVVSMNELAEMWEAKIGKNLEKLYISEEKLLKSIQDTPFPGNMELIFIYSIFIKSDHTNFSIESSGLNGTELYPHVKQMSVSEFLDTLL